MATAGNPEPARAGDAAHRTSRVGARSCILDRIAGGAPAAGADPRLAEAAERNGFAALVLGLLAFAARLACYEWLPVGEGYQAFNLLAQFLRGLASWWLVVSALGLGRKYLNSTDRALGIARDLSFPLYLLHYAPLTAATYLLLDSGLGIWPRWALSVLLSWMTVALCTFIFRFIPPLRSLFGIRAPRAIDPE